MNKASITFDARKIEWQYDNLWHKKWSMSDSNGLQINSSFATTSGVMESNSLDDLSLLTGLFVANYYLQMSMIVIVAALSPTWFTLFN